VSRRQQILAVIAVSAAAVTLVVTSPASSQAAPPAPAPPVDVWSKPVAAGIFQIDAAALAEGVVTVVTDPRPGLDDASLTVTGTGEAAADAEVTVPTEAASTSTAVAVDGAAPPANPAAAALAGASGSTVVATLRATDASDVVQSTSDRVWVDEFEGRTLVSESGEQDLRLQRVAALEDDGTVTAAEADALDAEILGGGAATTESVVRGACVQICVSGTVLWTDSVGGTHPVDRAPVQIRDANAGADTVVTTVTTNASGHYTAMIDDDDPEDATGRDVYVQVRADGPGFTLNQFIESGTDTNVPPGSQVTHDLTANNIDDNNTAFAVHASLVLARDYIVTVHGSPLPTVPVEFPDPSGSFYDGSLHILQPDRWDWDVSLHEYGHFVADRINIEANPGGPHSFSDNLSDARHSKSIGTRLAWGEGWPTYFAVSALQETAAGLGIPNIGDTRYQDTEDADLDVNLEAPHRLGEDNEATVMSVLWDLYDDVDEGSDHTSLGAQVVWDRLDDNDPTTLSAAYALFSPNRGNEGVNCIFTRMNVSPRIDGPPNSSVSQVAPRINWARGNGGTHRNNRFSVVFRRSGGPILFTSPFRPAQSFRPTQAQWNAIRSQTLGALSVTVVGRQVDAPVTGPYRSCTKTYIVT
jgi:hypothetical protein